MNFAEFLRTPFLQTTPGQLLLEIENIGHVKQNIFRSFKLFICQNIILTVF